MLKLCEHPRNEYLLFESSHLHSRLASTPEETVREEKVVS